jgi:putative heme-binding domain-containing protein
VPVAYFSPNALFEIEYADERIDLKKLGRVGSFTIKEWWHAVEHTREQEALFARLVSMLDDTAETVRMQAAHYLYLLDDERSEPAVALVRERSAVARLASAPLQEPTEVWAVGPFPLDGANPPRIEREPVDLSTTYDVDGTPRAWQKVVAHAAGASVASGTFDATALGNSAGPESVYVCFRLDSASRQSVALESAARGTLQVWLNGRELAHKSPTILSIEAGSNDVLVRLAFDSADRWFSLAWRALEPVHVALPEPAGAATLAQRLRDSATPVADDFLRIDWEVEAADGNADNGRRLAGSASLGCVKCHAFVAGQSGAGAPSLAEAARRFTVPQLVESILLPGRQVAEPFRASTIILADGRSLAGLVVSETAQEIDVLLPDAMRVKLAKADIEDRQLSNQSPMPSGLIKSVDELRDLLAYLRSENPLPP